jgi:hypothetical protein
LSKARGGKTSAPPAFFSAFDRFVVAPMLVTIALALGAPLAEVAATASLYYRTQVEGWDSLDSSAVTAKRS